MSFFQNMQTARATDAPWACLDKAGAVGSLLTRSTGPWKRAIDIAGSLAGLIMLLPIFILIAIFIKSVSPGPAFFRQKRVGLGGKVFECIKFRTMRPNADTSKHRKYLAQLIHDDRSKGPKRLVMTKLHNDPQIIPFGNLIRESGLDELPQLINVLRGEMSLVGPRPPIPYEVQEYKLWYKDRFDVLPGITGLWQVSGKNRLTFNEMIRLDIQYSRQMSLLLDLKILLLTPYAVFMQIRNYLHRKVFAQAPSTIHTA
ncbi:MAG: sugar transferase [Desulfobacteraceae bacterium]|nr:MAG: sugar transferase [Desulfobacteraceae bacterium]